jgi:adenine/guanine phosphoribosyltransferase-like PRPP-binding protein
MIEPERILMIGSARLYRDRADAGRKLASYLKQYAGRDVLVLGIPRGGVPVAAEVARELNAELDDRRTEAGAPGCRSRRSAR